MPQVKEFLRNVLYGAVTQSGITRIGRHVGKFDGTIIAYGHRVSDDEEGYLQGLKPEWLDEQLRYLTKTFEVISLQTLVDCLNSRKQVPKRSVVLTFDDGFRDNFTNALPLFEKYRVPATIFVVTGAVTNGQLPWSQRLGYLFQNTSVESISLTSPVCGEFPLTTALERKSAYKKVKTTLIPCGRELREAELSTLSRVLKVDPPKDRMITWDMAKQMMSAGVHLGAHTYSHPLLARIPHAEAIEEISRSKSDLDTYAGVCNPVFCFPAGSYNSALMSEVRTMGFAGTFLPGQAIVVNNLNSVDRYSMARVGLPNAPRYHLEAELDGPFHSARTSLHRLSPAKLWKYISNIS